MDTILSGMLYLDVRCSVAGLSPSRMGKDD